MWEPIPMTKQAEIEYDGGLDMWEPIALEAPAKPVIGESRAPPSESETGEAPKEMSDPLVDAVSSETDSEPTTEDSDPPKEKGKTTEPTESCTDEDEDTREPISNEPVFPNPEQAVESPTGTGLLETIKTVMTPLGYQYNSPEEGNDPRLDYIVKTCGVTRQVMLFVNEETNVFQYYMGLPVYVPEDKRNDVAVYLTYVNYDTYMGSFEMNMDDGEIRFKNYYKLAEGDGLSTEMVQEVFDSSEERMETFFPGLMAILYTGKDPQEAFNDCFETGDEAEEEWGDEGGADDGEVEEDHTRLAQ
ncbi:Pfam:DUF1790 [Seminavis robusta]|uniref:Pfam:DUF1790 n=1 Tax=Seminavis robusta TaxID=568900 RepID=A0A9N8DQL3_9STRA|nr:Pfam:DUF1790 [Seminavis robusta]|eukprot:Sro269_g103950.1 Pfam:DUF1790 (302) ;mRNA; f:29082-29987